MLDVSSPPKPLLRGVSHQVAFFVALAGAISLLFYAIHVRDSGMPDRPIWGVVTYGASLCGLFGTSALYHRVPWEPAAEAWMRRLDHSAIFALIAGTFTPLAVRLGAGAVSALSLIWGGAVLGMLQACFWKGAPRAVPAVLAVLLGWSMLPFLVALHPLVGSGSLALVGIGGVLYSAGAVVYARKRPDPSPHIFGYHEVFHALTIVAALCHYVAVVRVVGSA